MKKTLITLLALSGISMGATDATLTSGQELTYGLDDDVVKAIKTKDNADYNLKMPTPSTNSTGLSFNINADYYVNTFAAQQKSAITMNFGKTGSITSASNMDFCQKSTTVWNVDVAASALDGYGTGDTYTRVLLTAKGNNGIWNVGSNNNNTAFEYATFNDIDALTGYTNKGIINANNITNLKAGEYALVFSEGGKGATDTLSLVVKAVPEPTTATLSLLALSGLAARRRRR